LTPKKVSAVALGVTVRLDFFRSMDYNNRTGGVKNNRPGVDHVEFYAQYRDHGPY
jgi:hypothetical protein